MFYISTIGLSETAMVKKHRTGSGPKSWMLLVSFHDIADGLEIEQIVVADSIEPPAYCIPKGFGPCET